MQDDETVELVEMDVEVHVIHDLHMVELVEMVQMVDKWLFRMIACMSKVALMCVVVNDD